MGNKLYVGNVSFSSTEASLTDLFSQAGTVTSCKIITDRDTGRSKGFCFIEMSTEAEAQAAIAKFNTQEIDGRALTVSEARPQENRGGGGGGGGGFRGGRGGGGGGGSREGGRGGGGRSDRY